MSVLRGASSEYTLPLSSHCVDSPWEASDVRKDEYLKYRGTARTLFVRISTVSLPAPRFRCRSATNQKLQERGGKQPEAEALDHPFYVLSSLSAIAVNIKAK